LQCFAAATADDAVRVIVLTASGSTFSAGADVRAATAASSGSFADTGAHALVRVLETILDCPKPTIGRVQGHVAGGGNGLVAACDLAVAAETAKFAFTEVRVGVAAAVISVVCLPKMRPGDAAELLLTGERVSAERVREAGLITRVASPETLDLVVEGYVDALRRGGPNGMAATKQLLRRIPTMSRDDAFAWTSELSAQLFSSDEAREGMTAFLERRDPAWVSSR
jgi:enoyl-CoA hydratase/carnithine racemase